MRYFGCTVVFLCIKSQDQSRVHTFCLDYIFSLWLSNIRNAIKIIVPVVKKCRWNPQTSEEKLRNVNFRNTLHTRYTEINAMYIPHIPSLTLDEGIFKGLKPAFVQ